MVNREPSGTSGEGESSGVEGPAGNMTELRRRDDQLVQLRKLALVGQLASSVAHNFNNLLTSILGFTEMLLAESKNEPDNRALREIDRAAHRAAALTRQLLAFASPARASASDVDVNLAVGPVYELMASLIRHHITITFDTSAAAPVVRIETGQIEQAVVHLILNAQDALLDAGGRIQLSIAIVDYVRPDAIPSLAGSPGPWVQIQVADSGVGVPADAQRPLFEPFFITREPDGIGLGLSAVYDIARYSGGCVDVQTQTGVGTTVSLYLPAARERLGVLVVDDNPAVRAIAERILRARNFSVFGASTAAEAVEVFGDDRNQIGVLVTDLQLAATSGLDLARRLLASQGDLAVVFISGGSTPPVTADVGPVTLLSKPFDAHELVAAIQRALAARRSRG